MIIVLGVRLKKTPGVRSIDLRFSDVVRKLSSSGIDNAVTEAAYLVASLCGCNRDRLLLRIDDPELDSEAVGSAIEKRIGGYPLQYILGEWEFYGLGFKIEEGCLIPRSDTEILVDKAISILGCGVRFADVCCGSGCIAISVLKSRPDLSAVAVDLYDVPLSLTRKNATLHGVEDRLDVIRADVLSERESLCSALCGCELIISNPPYIPARDISALDRELFYEPETALCGGDDGMDFYRALLSISSELSVPALFEIGYDQGEAIKELAALYKRECTVYKDYSSNDRVAFIK